MKRFLAWALLATLIVIGTIGCPASGENAKQQALQALVTTTRSAVLLMTAAGIAYDAGAFGAPGSANAEATWQKIADESIRMNRALNSWQEAVRLGKDASAYSSIVMQALSIVGSLLPPPKRTLLSMPPEPWAVSVARLNRPDAFRAMGGAR